MGRTFRLLEEESGGKRMTDGHWYVYLIVVFNLLFGIAVTVALETPFRFLAYFPWLFSIIVYLFYAVRENGSN
jgi:hypothetical protein